RTPNTRSANAPKMPTRSASGGVRRYGSPSGWAVRGQGRRSGRAPRGGARRVQTVRLADPWIRGEEAPGLGPSLAVRTGAHARSISDNELDLPRPLHRAAHPEEA